VLFVGYWFVSELLCVERVRRIVGVKREWCVLGVRVESYSNGLHITSN